MRVPISGDSESIKFSNTGKARSRVHIKHSITSIDVSVLLFTDPFFTVPLSQTSALETRLHGNITLLHL